MRKFPYRQEDQSIVDKFIEHLRFGQVLPFIKSSTKVLDLGCGYDANFLSFIAKKIDFSVGIDLHPNLKLNHKKIKLIKGRVDAKLPVKSNQFDIVTSLAVIEHLKSPKTMLKEAKRVLKKGGVLIITTPSQTSKPILEFLSYKLKIVSKIEIADHKRYYNKISLIKELVDSGFHKNRINIRRFELGMNLLAIAKNI